MLKEDAFAGQLKRCIACVKCTNQRYRSSHKGVDRWQRYYANNGDTIRARANKQHHERRQNATYLFMCAKRRAKRGNIPFSIVESDVILPTHCPVLGIPLVFSLGGRTDNTPSLDRIDNSQGYVPGNVAVISWRANFMKRDLTLSDIELLHKYVMSHGN